MWIPSSLQAAKVPTRIALGNFDGVHLGHQRVMAEVADDKSAHEFVAGSLATVVTFSPHPQAFFLGVSRPLLTPVEEKASQLSLIGIQQLVILPFDEALAALSPEEFVEQVLVNQLKAQQISVGCDFRFGRGRSGDALGLEKIAGRYDVPVVRVPLREEKGDRISSSRIREALQTGELSEATQLLGRPYTLIGTVVEGKQLGRTIGFPTANLLVPEEKFLPRTGVYSVWVHLLDSQPIKGVMNIGNRPTVGGQELSIEIHLLDWSGDLYGQKMSVSLQHFVRGEEKFESLEALKAQIAKDCEKAKETLKDFTITSVDKF